MLKERANLVAAGLLLADVTAVTLAFVVAYHIRAVVLPAEHLVPGPLLPFTSYLVFLVFGTVLWTISLAGVGGYTSHRIQPFGREAWEVVKASGIAGLLFVVGLFVGKLDEKVLAGGRLSRGLVLLWVLCAVVALIAERWLIRSAAHRVRRAGRNYRNIIVVGTSEMGREIARAIRGHTHWGLRIVGFINERPEDLEGDLDGVPILGTWDRLIPFTETSVVDEVIIAAPDLPSRTTQEIVNRLGERGICARVGLLDPAVGGHLKVDRLGNVPLLSFDPTPVGELGLVFKRCVDFLVSLPLCLLLLPLFTILALLVRASSPGPVVFRQERVGLQGRRFALLKFRTMRVGAEEDRSELEHRNEMSGPVFKLRDDPRITGVGRFLRRSSLDELPQLWNVVKGDMSLVGPRPQTPKEVGQYQPYQRRRLSMRPGMTCLWQVEGRSDIDFEAWVDLDLEYIDNWSPWLDLRILLRTVPAVLSGRGAY